MTSTMLPENTLDVLANVAEEVVDAFEETFVLFTQDLPHNDLGILNPTASQVEVDVAGHEYIVKQSPALLKSTREAGTTGAVLWKVTPRLAEWLACPTTILWTQNILSKKSNIVELGCGIAGLVGTMLGPLVSTYILTDQAYVMKLLKENLTVNSRSKNPTSTSTSKLRSKGQQSNTMDLQTLPFDWEHDSVRNIKHLLSTDAQIDLVILCDCIYNTYLIEPLVQTCIDICLMHSSKSTHLLIAQQLRSDAVFEQWLQALMKHFQVYRIRDEHLPSTLQSTSGYAIHLAISSQKDGPEETAL